MYITTENKTSKFEYCRVPYFRERISREQIIKFECHVFFEKLLFS